MKDALLGAFIGLLLKDRYIFTNDVSNSPDLVIETRIKLLDILSVALAIILSYFLLLYSRNTLFLLGILLLSFGFASTSKPLEGGRFYNPNFLLIKNIGAIFVGFSFILDSNVVIFIAGILALAISFLIYESYKISFIGRIFLQKKLSFGIRIFASSLLSGFLSGITALLVQNIILKFYNG